MLRVMPIENAGPRTTASRQIEEHQPNPIWSMKARSIGADMPALLWTSLEAEYGRFQ
jgi:hypothetical protein